MVRHFLGFQYLSKEFFKTQGDYHQGTFGLRETSAPAGRAPWVSTGWQKKNMSRAVRIKTQSRNIIQHLDKLSPLKMVDSSNNNFVVIELSCGQWSISTSDTNHAIGPFVFMDCQWLDWGNSEPWSQIKSVAFYFWIIAYHHRVIWMCGVSRGHLILRHAHWNIAITQQTSYHPEASGV